MELFLGPAGELNLKIFRHYLYRLRIKLEQFFVKRSLTKLTMVCCFDAELHARVLARLKLQAAISRSVLVTRFVCYLLNLSLWVSTVTVQVIDSVLTSDMGFVHPCLSLTC